jgi:hypothetical protein
MNILRAAWGVRRNNVRRGACGVRRCSGSAARSLNRKHGHCDNMPRVVPQLLNSISRQQSGINRQFEPILGFIRFFFDNTHLRDEISARASAAGRPVVRADRGAGPHELITNHPPRPPVGQFLDQTNDRQRECFRQNLQLTGRHDLTFLRRTPHAAR